MPRQIAHFGGGFGPPQIVHRFAAEASLARFGRVTVMPCGPRNGEKDKEPLKLIKPLDRAFMADLAFRDLEGVTVDNSDLEKDDFTRAWDIEQQYRAQGFEAWHVLGTDWFTPREGKTTPPILDWYRGQEVWNECRFAILPREGYPFDPRHLPPNHVMLPACPDVSSSQVRDRIYKREPFEHLVLPEVAAYIKRRGLYLGEPPLAIAPFKGPLIPKVVADPEKPVALALAREIERASPDGPPNCLVVLGGDGMFMHAIREYWHLRLPFLGLNMGHAGHFMNRLQEGRDPAAILRCDDLVIRQSPLLHVEWQDPMGGTHTELGVNDAWLRNDAGQSAWLKLTVDGVVRIEKISGDGIVVASPFGSTGYAYTAGATPLFDQPGLVVAGLLLDRFRNWSPTHESADSVIRIEALDTGKRPVEAFIDSVPKGRAASMTVRSSRVAGIQIVFTPEDDLAQKRLRYKYPAPQR